MVQINHYVALDGQDFYVEWLKGVKDTTAKIAVVRRVARIELGNFGDHRYCRDGVWELRIDVGAGYRMYYAIAANPIVLLLSGGDKRKQDADINRACTLGRTGSSVKP